MYAIRNRRTKKWVYGTDYRYSPRRQGTSFDRALTYEDYDHAKLDFMNRQVARITKLCLWLLRKREVNQDETN